MSKEIDVEEGVIRCQDENVAEILEIKWNIYYIVF